MPRAFRTWHEAIPEDPAPITATFPVCSCGDESNASHWLGLPRGNAQSPAGPHARALRGAHRAWPRRSSTSCWPRATAFRAWPGPRTSTTRSALRRGSSSRRSRAPRRRRPPTRLERARRAPSRSRSSSGENVVDQALDPVEKEDAVHVVDLVEDGARLEPLALEARRPGASPRSASPGGRWRSRRAG